MADDAAADVGEGALLVGAEENADEGVEQERRDYESSALVRSLTNWEISRDHLVFGDMCGLDTAKRHVLHFLEPERAESDGDKGSVLLTAAGNTVQLLTLAPRSEDSGPSVRQRRYLFGLGGSGVGSLAVHPSREFFAVGEKGVKPPISIYRYPEVTVCRVLRNGTERAYASVEFSADGDTLASVGAAPDFLLTVWKWREEQTVLRCKAFGQEVFSVRFAPADSGFLATSGVGHIRLWKMAATFTGLKLQGDIGKFGKSELSDVEAFCVLPDKKVLSGTERGVLLLWDGNFIKCEILTSRRQLPHAGTVNVVDYDAEESQVVTAGKDGYVRFWSFDSVDSADVLADETVALVPVKRQVLVEPHMDIRAVVKEAPGRYLLQDGAGSVHLLTLPSDEEHHIEFDYVPNDTGRISGLACSPYEHLAATCGQDGSVRAWDYVSGSCLMAIFPELTQSASAKASAQGKRVVLSPASCIAWVPSRSAVVTEQIPASRQVAVGFHDGLVRVLLMDVEHRAWVRLNVFKPHSERVTCVAFSRSGSAFASASADATFFLFRVVPNSKTSKFATYQPEYEPFGFQRVPAAVSAICWRADGEALLATLVNGQVLEFFLPAGGLAAGGGDLGDDADSDGDTAAKTDEAGVGGERESYELHLPSREWALGQRNRFMSVKELEALETASASGNPVAEEKLRNGFQVETRAGPTGSKAWAALYPALHEKDRDKPLSRTTKDRVLLSCRPPLHGSLFLCHHDQPTPLQELASEASAHVTWLALSHSQRFLLCGLSNGKFQLRCARRPHAFLTGEFHDRGSAEAGQLQVALSFDDSYVLAAGSDGNLSISRLHAERVEEAAKLLAGRFENLQAEAAIAGDHARDKQESVLAMQQKALEAEKAEGGEGGAAASTEVGALPAFHRARAFAAYMESKLAPGATAAKDKEDFRGVWRLASDAGSTAGLVPGLAPLGGSSEDAAVGVPSASLLQLEAAEIEQPGEAYTIEDAKRKSEADARARSTQSKQDATRAVLDKMRVQLRELQAMDAALPAEHRVGSEEWEVDLDYGELLARQGDENCDEVRRELAFAVEREELLLLKLRETYVGPLAVELLTLHALESGLSVQSFRTMKMPASLQKRLAEIHTAEAGRRPPQQQQQQQQQLARRRSVLHILEKDTPLDDEFPLREDERRLIQERAETAASVSAGGHGAAAQRGADSGPPAAQTEATGGSKSVHGFEARKRLRGERQERLARWQAAKPGEDADDPRDVVAIAFAKRNMGDYKLKTAADYVVPEQQRVNAVKKLRQMALLEESLYAARLRFNAKLLALRELKLQLLAELRRDHERLRELHAALGVVSGAAGAAPLAVDLREWPEQRERVSEADLELYLRDKRVTPHTQATATLEAVGGSGASQEERKPTDRSIAALARTLGGSGAGEASAGLRVGHLRLQMMESGAVSVHATTPAAEEAPAPAPAAEAEGADAASVRAYLLRGEALALRRKQRREVAALDAAVAHLRAERLALAASLKRDELRLLTLHRELALLESFESKENLLSSKLEKSAAEKAQVVAELRDVQELLAAKKREAEDWARQERAVQAEFLALVNGAGANSAGTPHPSLAALQKLFRRKLKRPKKKAGGEKDGKEGGEAGESPESARDGEEEEEEEEEEEAEEDYDEDEDESDEEEEDACPAGCELALYEKVLALRERRADVDDALGELARATEELRKAGERQTARQRGIDKELAATEQDAQLFQSEKQARFNELDVVVALSARQLRCLQPSEAPRTAWRLPTQAAECLVFSTRAFAALSERIEALQRENRQLRQQFRDLHRQQSVLARDKRQQQAAIAQAQERGEQLQRLKFGQLVDLEVLDRACDASALQELRARVAAKELAAERSLRSARQTQPELQRAILRATERNTELLTRLAALAARQAALERALNQDDAGGGALRLEDDAALAQREMRERNKLVRLVKLQAREVEALKQEIGLLRGKDGKVYAPRV